MKKNYSVYLVTKRKYLLKDNLDKESASVYAKNAKKGINPKSGSKIMVKRKMRRL